MAWLQQQDVLKLRALRLQIKAGVDELDRGDFVELDEGDLEAYLETLTTGADENAR